MNGIYQIQSKIKPTRIYIGSSLNVNKRIASHKRMLNTNTHNNIKMQRHANKYGIDDLKFTFIAGCDKNSLIPNEQFYIDSYSPWFNIAPQAGSTVGYKCTEEQAERRRNILKPYRGCNKGIKYPQAMTGGYVICKVCGKSFYVKKSRLGIKKYCSKECMGKDYAERMSGNTNPNYKNLIKICPVCGKKYVNYSIRNKYCSIKCRDLARWGNKEERQKRFELRMERRKLRKQNEKQSRISIM